MIDWIKRLVAGKELDELEAWRVRWQEARLWMGEFPDAADTLDHVRNSVTAGPCLSRICAKTCVRAGQIAARYRNHD